MDVQVLDRPGTDGRTSWVVQPNGQLDMDTAPRLAEALQRLMEAGDRRIVVDLGRLTFCDSMGLSTLVVAHRSSMVSGGYVRLARPNPFMLNLLTVVGLRDVLDVYDSVDAACG
jgi:anti-sigma B factor antagonist